MKALSNLVKKIPTKVKVGLAALVLLPSVGVLTYQGGYENGSKTTEKRIHRYVEITGHLPVESGMPTQTMREGILYNAMVHGELPKKRSMIFPHLSLCLEAKQLPSDLKDIFETYDPLPFFAPRDEAEKYKALGEMSDEGFREFLNERNKMYEKNTIEKFPSTGESLNVGESWY